jgi:sugar (pentulose or hexulose) kinase
MALPNFSSGSGPFGDHNPEIRGTPHHGAALATLYCAMMVDHCLDLLQVKGEVIIVGSYLKNPLLCSLICQLRGDQPVFLSSDEAGTIRGVAQLTNWSTPVSLSSQRCVSSEITGLEDYRSSWQEQIRAAI